jgi:hypothetical protein
MPLKTAFEGKSWKIYYFSIDDFETEMGYFLKFLDDIDYVKEEVVSVITNVGFVKTAIIMGTSFTGVKGYAVIVRKNVESIPDPSGIKISNPPPSG